MIQRRRANAAAVLCVYLAWAPETALAGNPTTNVIQSRDGLGHWLHLAPVWSEAVLREPPDDVPIVHDRTADGEGWNTPQLVVTLECREETLPPGAVAYIAKHPNDPEARRLADRPVRSLLREGLREWLGWGNPPPVFVRTAEVVYRTRDRERTSSAKVTRKLATYNTESDYEVVFDAGVLLALLRGAKPGDGLRIEIRTPGRWHVSAAYRLDHAALAAVEAIRKGCLARAVP